MAPETETDLGQGLFDIVVKLVEPRRDRRARQMIAQFDERRPSPQLQGRGQRCFGVDQPAGIGQQPAL